MNSATPYRHLLFDLADGLAAITLNRPHSLNALHAELLDELIDALDRVAVPGAARTLLLSGSGRAFSAGADLNADHPAYRTFDAGAILQTHYNPLFERLAALPIPIVAAVNGAAAGAGCSLAFAADFVVANRSAYFLLSFVNIGLVPDAGITWLLPRLVGCARATQMMMLGERIAAQQARDWGLIYACVEDADLNVVAPALAQRLAHGPTRAYGLIRTQLRACMQSDFSTALAIEREHQRQAGSSADFAEGVIAFLDRRTPVFRGN